MKRVAVFGAGVAGLTTAHALVLPGFSVDVYENRLCQAAWPGAFRSPTRASVFENLVAAARATMAREGQPPISLPTQRYVFAVCDSARSGTETLAVEN